MRRLAPRNEPSASAMTPKGNPTARPTAMAASALAMLCMPRDLECQNALDRASALDHGAAAHGQ